MPIQRITFSEREKIELYLRMRKKRKPINNINRLPVQLLVLVFQRNPSVLSYALTMALPYVSFDSPWPLAEKCGKMFTICGFYSLVTVLTQILEIAVAQFFEYAEFRWEFLDSAERGGCIVHYQQTILFIERHLFSLGLCWGDRHEQGSKNSEDDNGVWDIFHAALHGRWPKRVAKC